MAAFNWFSRDLRISFEMRPKKQKPKTGKCRSKLKLLKSSRPKREKIEIKKKQITNN